MTVPEGRKLHLKNEDITSDFNLQWYIPKEGSDLLA